MVVRDKLLSRGEGCDVSCFEVAVVVRDKLLSRGEGYDVPCFEVAVVVRDKLLLRGEGCDVSSCFEVAVVVRDKLLLRGEGCDVSSCFEVAVLVREKRLSLDEVGSFGRGLENRGIWPNIDAHVSLSAWLVSDMLRVVVVAGLVWVMGIRGFGGVEVLRVD